MTHRNRKPITNVWAFQWGCKGPFKVIEIEEEEISASE